MILLYLWLSYLLKLSGHIFILRSSYLLVCPIFTAATYLEISAGITSKYLHMSMINLSHLVHYMGIRAGLAILAAT